MKRITCFFIALFLVSCTSNTIYKKPESLIPKDTMMSLLTDMYLVSSAKYVKNKLLQKDVNYMPLVYEKYKIDSTRFDISNTYYTSRLEEYTDMLKEVKKRIEHKNSIYTKEIRIKDSLEKEDNLRKEKDILSNQIDLDTLKTQPE